MGTAATFIVLCFLALAAFLLLSGAAFAASVLWRPARPHDIDPEEFDRDIVMARASAVRRAWVARKLRRTPAGRFALWSVRRLDRLCGIFFHLGWRFTAMLCERRGKRRGAPEDRPRDVRGDGG